MKNVADYDVSRLLPGSMGTLSLLLEASVKVLPKHAATITLRCQISQANALKILNTWAEQPLPLSASCWIGDGEGDGELTIRLSGAVAAVKAAIPIMGSQVNAHEIPPETAQAFWDDLREQNLPIFMSQETNQTLYRFALPAACGPLDIPNASGDLALEWHGQQRWIKAAGDDATFHAMKHIANIHGGHATRFKQGKEVIHHWSGLHY